MKRLLITGAAGRLGSELAWALSQKGYLIRAFDLESAPFERIKGVKGLEVFRGDITRQDDVEEAVRGVDVVFHLAAVLSPLSEKNKKLSGRVNVIGTQNVVEAVKYVGSYIPVVFASSVSVYGVTAKERPPISTSHPLTPTDNYSLTKIEAEKSIRTSGVPYVILRVSGVYAVELMELPDIVPFRRDQRVEFIDRRDVITAFTSTMGNPRALNGVFNISGGSSWRMTGEEFLTEVYSAFDMEVEPHYSPDYTYFDWYDTADAQSILKFQRVNFEIFINELGRLAKELFE